jgi:hypothetical protein
MVRSNACVRRRSRAAVAELPDENAHPLRFVGEICRNAGAGKDHDAPGIFKYQRQHDENTWALRVNGCAGGRLLTKADHCCRKWLTHPTGAK